MSTYGSTASTANFTVLLVVEEASLAEEAEEALVPSSEYQNGLSLSLSLLVWKGLVQSTNL